MMQQFGLALPDIVQRGTIDSLHEIDPGTVSLRDPGSLSERDLGTVSDESKKRKREIDTSFTDFKETDECSVDSDCVDDSEEESDSDNSDSDDSEDSEDLDIYNLVMRYINHSNYMFQQLCKLQLQKCQFDRLKRLYEMGDDYTKTIAMQQMRVLAGLDDDTSNSNNSSSTRSDEMEASQPLHDDEEKRKIRDGAGVEVDAWRPNYECTVANGRSNLFLDIDESYNVNVEEDSTHSNCM
jgi:uncharacterized sporulation protein YeaH/YhbH (DUF444 family)